MAGLFCFQPFVCFMKPIYTYLLAFMMLIGLITLFWLYRQYDPAMHHTFPSCPLRSMTGYQCPACGGQRAAHQLFNGNLSQAFQANPLFVISVPYICTGLLLLLLRKRSRRVAVFMRIGYGKQALTAWIVAILIFWVVRNLG